MSTPRRLAFLGFITVIGFVGPAGATEGGPAQDDVALARQLSDAGMRLFQQGDYDGALAAFNRSYALAREPALLFDIAQVHRKKGECEAALAYYRRYLGAVDAVTAGQAKVSVHIEQMQGCLRQLPAADRNGAEVTSNVGSPPATDTRIDLLRTEPAVPSSAPPLEPASGSRRQLIGTALGTIGVAALAAAVVASLQVSTLQDRVSNAYDQGGPATPALAELVSEGRRYQTASEILYASGAAALVTGAVLYYWGARHPDRPRPLVTGSSDGAELALRFSFF